MPTYIHVNRDASLYRRDTSKISVVSSKQLVQKSMEVEEPSPPTVRKPEGYHVDFNWDAE